jgi:hypothetical protein
MQLRPAQLLSSTLYLLHFESVILSSTYLYKKDERALPGNLHNGNFCFHPKGRRDKGRPSMR